MGLLRVCGVTAKAQRDVPSRLMFGRQPATQGTSWLGLPTLSPMTCTLGASLQPRTKVEDHWAWTPCIESLSKEF